MGLLDRLDELDYRLRLRPRPGTDRAQVQPLSTGRVRFLRVIWAAWLVLSVLVVVAAVVWSRWWLSLSLVAPLAQLVVMDPGHRRQVFRRSSR